MKFKAFVFAVLRFVPVFILCVVGCVSALCGVRWLDRWCENTLHHYELLA